MGAAVGDGNVAVGAEDVFVKRPGVDGVREDGFQALVQGQVKEGVDGMLAFGCRYFGDGAAVIFVISLVDRLQDRYASPVGAQEVLLVGAFLHGCADVRVL